MQLEGICMKLHTCLHFLADRRRCVCVQWCIVAWATDFPFESTLSWPCGWWCRARTVVLPEKILTHKSLIAAFTPEPKVLRMKSLVFTQVRPTCEGSSTCLASVRLRTHVWNNVSFQLVWPTELFCTACNRQHTSITIFPKQQDLRLKS